MKVALYARVSKAIEQNPENQLIELRKWADASGHQVIGEFVDEISSKDTRPQKELVLRKLRLGEADGVAFVALDRWGRTMSELVFELEEFSRTGKSIISLKEGIDLSNAAGRLMANVLASMANFERDRIRERTLLGLARARAQGKKLGRPRKTPPANPEGFQSKKEGDEKTSVFPIAKKGDVRKSESLKIFEAVLAKEAGNFAQEQQAKNKLKPTPLFSENDTDYKGDENAPL